jgi:hypothetical protein
VAQQAQQAGDFQTAQALVAQANEVQAKQTSTRKTLTELETEQNRVKNATQFVKGRLPDLTEEQAAAIAADKEAVRKLLESPKTSTKTVEAGGRVLLINDQTGETIKDLGAKGKGELSALAGSIGQLAASMAGPRAENAAKAEGTEVGKAVAQIQGKQDALVSLQTSRSLLRGPDGKFNIYAGLFGPEETVVAKATKGLLGNRDKAINTENFLAEISTTVIPLLQEFGGNDSNEELRFLQRVVGGDQRLEPESIERIIKSAEAKIQRGIQRVQRQQEAVLSGQPLPTGATNSGNVVDFSTLKRN